MADEALVDQVASAIANLGEKSGGRYDELGMVIPKTGDRAYGKYQIMGNNIPQWTQEALGKPLDPQAFLADPDAQEKTARHRMGVMLDEYGDPRDVASIWHSGVPYAQALKERRKDPLGTTTQNYADRVAAGIANPADATPPPAAPAKQPTYVRLPDGVYVNMGLDPTPDMFAQLKTKVEAKYPQLQRGAQIRPGDAVEMAQPTDLGGVDFATDPRFNTALSPDEETQFQAWKQQYAPRDSGVDYDLRGAFKAGLTPGANGHFDDAFKKPNHPTFSTFSKYAPLAPDRAGTWQGDEYIPPTPPGTASTTTETTTAMRPKESWSDLLPFRTPDAAAERGAPPPPQGPRPSQQTSDDLGRAINTYWGADPEHRGGKYTAEFALPFMQTLQGVHDAFFQATPGVTGNPLELSTWTDALDRSLKILRPLGLAGEMVQGLVERAATDAGAPSEIATVLGFAAGFGAGMKTPVPGLDSKPTAVGRWFGLKERPPLPEKILQGTRQTRAAAAEAERVAGEAEGLVQPAEAAVETTRTAGENATVQAQATARAAAERADLAATRAEEAARRAAPSVEARTTATEALAPGTPGTPVGGIGVVEGGAPKPLAFAKPAEIDATPADPKYAYHVTNTARVQEIADAGELRTHLPHEFTDQDIWPDGSTRPRAYFADSPKTYFAPEEGQAAVVRVPRDAVPLQAERHTKDLYTSKSVPADKLEVLGPNGEWQPLVGREAVAEAPIAGRVAAGAVETSPRVAEALETKLGEVKGRASATYRAPIEAAENRAASLAPEHGEVLLNQLDTISAELGKDIPPDAQAVFDELRTALENGERVGPDLVDSYLQETDKLFKGRAPYNATTRQKMLYDMKWRIRDALRSMYDTGEQEWVAAADDVWRNEVTGRENPAALGRLVKLARSAPATFVARVLGTGRTDQQAYMAQAVMRHLGDAPLATEMRAAQLAREIDAATDKVTGELSQTKLLDNIGKYKQGFYDAIIGKPQANVLKAMAKAQAEVGETATAATAATREAAAAERGVKEATGTAKRTLGAAEREAARVKGEAEGLRGKATKATEKAAEPNRAARIAGRGLELLAIKAGHMVGGWHGAEAAAAALGAGRFGFIIPKINLAKVIADNKMANLVARAMATPATAPGAVTTLEAIRNRNREIHAFPEPTE